MSDEELPEGWADAPLGAVADLVSGVGFPLDLQGKKDLPYPFFKVGNLGEVESGNVLLASDHTVDDDLVAQLKARILPAGTVLFAKIGMAIRLNRRRQLGVAACIDNNVMGAIPATNVVPKYLLRFLETVDLMPMTQATTVPSLRKSELVEIPVPIPPLPEQHRIVEKVEALLAEVNAARDRLAKVPAILKRFRQSVLAAACSGRLTEDWRDANPDVPSAQAMLSDLFAERQRRHEREAVAARASGTRKPTTPRNLAPAFVPADLPELPSRWTWALFDDVCDDITVGHVGPMANEYVPKGIPFLRSQNVRPFRFDADGLKFVTRAFHERLAKCALKPWDLVVVRSGNAGEACVVPPELREANCADLVVMRPSRALDSYYGELFINSSAARAHIDEVKVGIAQGHYNIGSARQTPVPLPPLAEQQAIVEAVRHLFALADTIEAQVKAATARADRLPRAILSKAFKGELVPTEAELARTEGRTYETAEALLARVSGSPEPAFNGRASNKPRRIGPTGRRATR